MEDGKAQTITAKRKAELTPARENVYTRQGGHELEHPSRSQMFFISGVTQLLINVMETCQIQYNH